MSSGLLVKKELYNLTAEGVAQEYINFKSVTLQSSKYVCVRDKAGDAPSILVVDLSNDRPVANRHRITADGALMNPASNTIALKDDASSQIQIFNLDTRVKLKSTPFSEPIVHWSWASPSVLAYVTATAVYHWSMAEGQEPAKFFDRAPELADKQILAYKVDAASQYALLTGIKKEGDALVGTTQFFSVANGAARVVNEHAGSFCSVAVPGQTGAPRTVMCLANASATAGTVSVVEVPTGGRPPALGRQVGNFPVSGPGDFPVAVYAAEQAGLLYVVMRGGAAHVFNLFNLRHLDSAQLLTGEPMFVSVPTDSGVIGVTTRGSVVGISVNFQLAAQHAHRVLADPDLALRLAAAGNVEGAAELFVSKFNSQLSAGDVMGACQTARAAPKDVLRNREIIDRLGAMPVTDPAAAPQKLYFKVMLEHPPLNAVESVVFANIALARGQSGHDFVVNMYNKGDMTASAELGDLIRDKAPDLALDIYRKVGAKDRMIGAMLAKGDVDAVLSQYATPGETPNWLALLSQTLNAQNPAGAQTLASAIYRKHGASAVEPNRVVDLFVQRSHIKQAIGYLLDILGDRDVPEDAALQTRLFEVALQCAPPQVADKIFDHERGHSHYDKVKVAAMCEKAGLYHRALTIYARLRAETGAEGHLTAMRRCFQHTETLSPDFVEDFFCKLSRDDSLVILKELLSSNLQGNFKVVVRVACTYAETIGIPALIELFLSFNTPEIVYYFLQRTVPTTKDPEAHFRYIEAAAKLGNFTEVERMTRESDYYDPERVKGLLKELRLADMWPLVNVCDKHNMVTELVRYLYDNKKEKYIEQYVQKRAPTRLPDVAAALLDVDAPEDYIKMLVMSIGGVCPVEPLVEAFESRNRLRLLRPWLDAQREEGNTDVALYNAIGKILVDTNDRAEQFLQTDNHYDKLVLGKYCDKRDPHLALICYTRGQCDDQILELTTKNCMFKQQAQYLVTRKSTELWAKALSNTDSEVRQPLIDQVVNSVLPESKDTDEVITTVRSFMDANLSQELIALLEKIVLGPSEFRGNATLSNVLLQTALQADSPRVMELIQRLDTFDAAAVEQLARQRGRFEELFAMFKRFGKAHPQAVRVLVDDIKDLNRAVDYAERLQEGEPSTREVWGIIGRAQLKAGDVISAIGSLIRANDPEPFEEVVAACSDATEFTELVKFLMMCRVAGGGKLKPSAVDTQIVVCLAKTQRLGDLEEFLAAPNATNSDTLARTGEQLMNEGFYEAARVLFSTVSNWGKLAACLVKLHRYEAAVDAAQKANSIRTWKEVCFACVTADPPEFRLAQSCAWHVVVHVDELEEVVAFYEQRGLYDEIIAVLTHGMTHERAPFVLFTELGILLARHRPEKLIDHIKRFAKKIQPHKLVRVCEIQHLWVACRVLYAITNEPDNALRVVLEHPGTAWDHDAVKEIASKVSSPDLLYRVIHLYLEIFPEGLQDIFDATAARLDPARVIAELRSRKQLALGQKYLEAIAGVNLPAVNEALHELYIGADDFQALITAIDAHGNFDQVALAQRLEKHELVEFRRVAAKLYKKNNKWRPALDLAKRDKLYKDAAEAAAESQDQDLVEELLRWFLENNLSDSFAAALCTCYDLVRPDVALELAWRHKIVDCAMPYVIQYVKDQHHLTRQLEKKVEALSANAGPLGGAGGAGHAPQVLQITAGPGGFGAPTPQPTMSAPRW